MSSLNIYATKQDCGIAAGKMGAGKIRAAIAEKGSANIIIATGASQFDMLQTLVKEEGIDWSKVTMFHLDEYVGLPESHPASFRKYIKERFLANLPSPIGAAYFVEGDAPDTQKMCDELGETLKKHPIDVAFIGIGENGHIVFNDPPADFDTEEPYIVVDLDEVCRKQQLGEGWFPTFDDVPKQAVSMAVRQIMKSKTIINTVPDGRKAYAVRITFQGELSNMHPASVVRLHSDCHTFCDADSAAELPEIAKVFCTR